MSKSNKNGILLLFDRPNEPIFIGKSDRNIFFNIPVEYLPQQYQSAAPAIMSNHNSTNKDDSIKIKQIDLPDLTIPMKLGRRDQFSLFIPAHRKYAGHLIDIFLGMKTYDDLLSVAVYCRDRLNSTLFIYCLSVAILHREDTKHLSIPSFSEIFPDKYLDALTLAKAREVANVAPDGSREPIEIPLDRTGSNRDEEHRVAYWREDVGINLHHWHWHLVYPFSSSESILKKDRRGELFYYMHQQLMARYNVERLCNGLDPVKKLSNLREPIIEGYFPKLNSLVANRDFPSRPSGITLRDIARDVDEIRVSISDLEQWKEKIYNAIYMGSVVDDKGKKVILTEKEGIDILGNIVEASTLSVNPELYGDVHNSGHIAIALVHDPDYRYLESFGVMGDFATAMRDPIFYRWHAVINDIFLEHKNQLPQYRPEQLEFRGVKLGSIELMTPNNNNHSNNDNVMTLSTFWNKSDIELSGGLDFSPRGSILARITHLNYAPFSYKINVNNENNLPVMGTCRIFMGPKYDEHNKPLDFHVQKNLMIEMDKFTVSLTPGNNVITRMSSDSSVTIPFERTFRDLNDKPADGPELEEFNYCGCGWPEHMLLPRGKTDGYPMVLFVMISDFRNDIVVQEPPTGCADAVSFCGLRDRKYPDAQSMGFPFDRNTQGVSDIRQFLTPNMAAVDVEITFSDTVQPRPKSADKTEGQCCRST